MKDLDSRHRALLAAILEETSDFVGTADPGGRTVYVNRSGRRLMGLGEHEDVSRFAIPDFHPEEVGRLLMEEAIPHAVKHGVWRGLTRIRSLDGREFPASQVVIAHRDGSGHLVFLSTIARDITEQIEAERASREATEQLARAHDLLAGIIRNTPAVAIQGYDLDCAITFWNPASERLYGFTEAEAVGKRLADLILTPEEAREWEQQARSAVARGEPLPIQQWQTRGKGGEVRSILSSTFPLSPRQEDDPKATHLVCMDVDITERIRAEEQLVQSLEARRTLEEQLVHAQKLESLGRLAGGIAHDFNNLLTVILGYVSLAAERPGLEGELLETLDHVREAAERGGSLVSQLLAFARRQIHQPRAVELGELLRRLEQLLRRVIGEDVELLVESQCALRVSADAGQLEQVLVNLAVNARDAMEHGGRLTIRTRPRTVDEELARKLDLAPGDYAELVVEDNGSGMTDEVKQRAFEPFFTTKPFGVGTGLGLATCYGIVRQHDGAIWLDSQPGVGTESHILLPLTEAPLEKRTRSALPERLARAATVLVVEDEPEVRKITLRILSRAGIDAIGAANAEEARAVMRAQPAVIDALVSDIVMPDTSGPELVAELRAHKPELKVLFVTGYSTENALDTAIPNERTGLLQKPFSPAALVTALVELLDCP